MGGFARRIAALGLCLGLTVTACGKSTPASSSATVPPATPTTTAPADPYAIPATIDADYLNRVFVALEHVNGDASRLIVTNKQLVQDAARRLVAIYGSEEFAARSDVWLDELQAELPGFRALPGDRHTTVVRIVSTKVDCVYVEVTRDYNEVRTELKPPSREYVALRPLDTKRDPNHFNPTPWVISGEGFNTDGSTPKDPCAS